MFVLIVCLQRRVVWRSSAHVIRRTTPSTCAHWAATCWCSTTAPTSSTCRLTSPSCSVSTRCVRHVTLSLDCLAPLPRPLSRPHPPSTFRQPCLFERNGWKLQKYCCFIDLFHTPPALCTVHQLAKLSLYRAMCWLGTIWVPVGPRAIAVATAWFMPWRLLTPDVTCFIIISLKCQRKIIA